MITPILKDIIFGRFLLEGATYLGNNKVAFVNVYNSKTLDGLENSRVTERSAAYHLDLKTKQLKSYEFEKGICASAVAPTLSDNILSVITNIGIFKWDINNNTLSLWHEFNFTNDWPSGTRSNDCRVDPDGNLLVSWMGEGAHRDGLNTQGIRNKQGELWQIRPDHTETKLIDDLYIPNGHVFIPTEQNNVYRVLFNDTARTFKDPTLPRAVDEYLYDSKNS